MAPARALSLIFERKAPFRQLVVSCGRYLHTTAPHLLKAQDPAGSDLPQQGNNQDGNAPKHDDQRRSLPSKGKTVSQADAEFRERLEQMSGEGGASGVEYEDGKPNAMKRGVRNNMFRLI